MSVVEGKNLHFNPNDNKPLCSYSNKLCRQRRLNGYGFCIRHILEDKSAPFKQCEYVTRNNSQKCLNAIPNKSDRGYCHSHMQVAGIIPKKIKQPKSQPVTPTSASSTNNLNQSFSTSPITLSTSNASTTLLTKTASDESKETSSSSALSASSVPISIVPKKGSNQINGKKDLTKAKDITLPKKTTPKTKKAPAAKKNQPASPTSKLKTDGGKPSPLINQEGPKNNSGVGKWRSSITSSSNSSSPFLLLTKLPKIEPKNEITSNKTSIYSTFIPNLTATSNPVNRKSNESRKDFLSRVRLMFKKQLKTIKLIREDSIKVENNNNIANYRSSLISCAMIDQPRTAHILVNGEDEFESTKKKPPAKKKKATNVSLLSDNPATCTVPPKPIPKKEPKKQQNGKKLQANPPNPNIPLKPLKASKGKNTNTIKIEPAPTCKEMKNEKDIGALGTENVPTPDMNMTRPVTNAKKPKAKTKPPATIKGKVEPQITSITEKKKPTPRKKQSNSNCTNESNRLSTNNNNYKNTPILNNSTSNIILPPLIKSNLAKKGKKANGKNNNLLLNNQSTGEAQLLNPPPPPMRSRLLEQEDDEQLLENDKKLSMSSGDVHLQTLETDSLLFDDHQFSSKKRRLDYVHDADLLSSYSSSSSTSLLNHSSYHLQITDPNITLNAATVGLYPTLAHSPSLLSNAAQLESMMNSVLSPSGTASTPDGVITDASFDSPFDHSTSSHPDCDFSDDVDDLEKFEFDLDPDITHQASRLMEENGLTEDDFNDLFPEARSYSDHKPSSNSTTDLEFGIDFTSSFDSPEIDYSVFANMFPNFRSTIPTGGSSGMESISVNQNF